MVEIITKKTEKRWTESELPHVVFLLDASQSMTGQEQQVVADFNEYVSKVRGKTASISLYIFDSEAIIEMFYKLSDAEVPLLTLRDYRPSSMTPLFDAMGKVITKFSFERKVHFITHTDGLENDSKQFDFLTIDKMIEQKTSGGWLFTHLGEGIQGRQQAKAFRTGVKMAFSAGARGQALDMLSDTTALYARTGSTSASLYTGNAEGEVDVDEVTERSAQPEPSSAHPLHPA